MMQQLAPPAPPPLRHQRDASSRQQPRQGFSSSRQQHNITRRRQAWRDAHSSSNGNGSSSRDGIAQHQQGVVLPQPPQPSPQQQLQQQPPWQQPQQPLQHLQQAQHSSNGYVSASLQGGSSSSEQPESSQQQPQQPPPLPPSSQSQQQSQQQPSGQFAEQQQQQPPGVPQQAAASSSQGDDSGSTSSSSTGSEQPLQPQQPLATTTSSTPATTSSSSSSTSPTTTSSSSTSSSWQSWPPDVPWGLDTVVGVLSLWLLAYVAIGQLLVPSVLSWLDLERAAMSARELALLNLSVDCFQAALTLLMLSKCLGRYRPRTRGLFPLRWQRGVWLTWVAAGVGCFPVIDWVWKRGTSLLLGTEVQLDDMFHTQIELGLYTGDVITIGCYVIIVGVLAPLWEEVLFRGFLLPSLAKLVTPLPAVTLTALLFAWMHSSSEAIVPLLLVALGCGVLLVRFDNLLPPILLHGLYNLYVFANMAVQLYCGCGPVIASLSVSFGAAALLLVAAGVVRWRSGSGLSSVGGGSGVVA